MEMFFTICIWAQLSSTAPKAPTLTDAGAVQALIEELRDQLVAQRELIEQNSKELAEQRAIIATLQRQVAGAPAAQVAAASEPRQDPDLPQEFVRAGEFAGSIAIPGTDSAFRIGGQARSTFVHSLNPLGEDDRFITSS